MNITSYFRYWGKADPNYPGEPKWHPLLCHCLDVAAVAGAWWDASPVIRRTFLAAFNQAQSAMHQLRAWVLFFVALHDLGKFDVRFQLKAEDALRQAWPEVDLKDVDPSAARSFDHGHWGFSWAIRECPDWTGTGEAPEIRDEWRLLLAAVTGHHGDLPQGADTLTEYAEGHVMAHDRDARRAAVSEFAKLFLAPEGLGVSAVLPRCTPASQALLAGFCAVCDWIGSNVEAFPYRTLDANIHATDYFDERVRDIHSENLLHCLALIANVNSYGGVDRLLGDNESPRGVQTLVDKVSVAPGLTLIEAPTGSGKTEAALGYAWRLLNAGLADSIVFALPTQATANAMLIRTEAFAVKAFDDANVVLAHGKSQLNPEFDRLVAAGRRQTAQGKEEAAVQCAAWLASSRKRVFLGQVGVCTVDQVLLSVLPVRHKFVRGFGINKSVLIVDEIHAYDAYMHGLLGEILRRQKAAGGSAILLSATLPRGVRTKLFGAWQAEETDAPPYPALWCAAAGAARPLSVSEEERPKAREVAVEFRKLPGAFPDDAVLASVVAAAEGGACVAVVLNLVDDAQRVARALRTRTNLPIDLFHARYRFVDRQEKERAVIGLYGRRASRDGGRILVATQVVEQSLDLDFDWMVTQICPVDLLFQRLGRLHRHDRARPNGVETPRCTVLSVEGQDYGLHKLIYGNTRVLWRTERLLTDYPRIVFPNAYREWLEQVYEESPWDDEPDGVYGAYRAWRQDQDEKEMRALRYTSMTMSQFRDEDAIATSLTRDDEMSLTVLPIQPNGCMLDGQMLDRLDDRTLAEVLNLNGLPAPASWKRRLAHLGRDEEGRVLMVMTNDELGDWVSEGGDFRYSMDFGLERGKHESS